MTSFSKSELIRALSEVQYGIKSYRVLEDMCDVHQAVSEVDLLENQQIKVKLTSQGYEVLKDNNVLDTQICETLEQLLSNQSPFFRERHLDEIFVRLSRVEGETMTNAA